VIHQEIALAQEDLRLCLEHISLTAVATCVKASPQELELWVSESFAGSIPLDARKRITRLAHGLR
jgi:hypothetical protein